MMVTPMTCCNREEGLISSSSLVSAVVMRMEHGAVSRQQDCRRGRRRRRRRIMMTLTTLSSANPTLAACIILVLAAMNPLLCKTTTLMVDAQQQSMEGSSGSSSSLCGGGLTCLNNATCRNNSNNNGTDKSNGSYCDCPVGFADVDCGRLVRECHYVAGDRSITAECYNGGTCLPELYIVHHNNNNNQAANENDDESPLCDCSAAWYKGQRYVGKYCEMPLDDKSMCGSSSTTTGGGKEEDDDMAVMDRHFCLHGGTCLETNGDGNGNYCDCATGFRGPHCEFAIQYDPACDLTCENGGVCSFGGSTGGGGTIQKQEHATSWGSRGAQHCLCPAGFAGVQCEHVVDVCTGGQQQQQVNGSTASSKNGNNHGVCLHGSTCDYTSSSPSSLNREGKYDCTCPASQNYMGGTCKKEHVRMELCSPSTPGVAEYAFGMAVAAFCVNGGKCKDIIQDNNQVLPGCDCPPLFEGPHCEHLKSAAQIKGLQGGALHEPNDDGKGNMGRAFSIFLATLVALMGGFLFWRQVRRCRRARKRGATSDATLNLQGFRDYGYRDEVPGTASVVGTGAASSYNDEEEEHRSQTFAVGEVLHEVDIN